jgi:ribonuclease P protein component
MGRLRRRREFLRVARGRRKWAARGLVLQVRDAVDSGAEARVGFTASRKVGNAVARNRAKRRLRAAVGEVMPACAAPGIDYVIIARGATLTRRYSDLLADLKTALRRVGALRSDCRRG